MTSTLERPVSTETIPTRTELQVGGASGSGGSTRASVPSRVRLWARAHRASLLWLLPTLAVGGAIQAINMTGSPARIDDEGTYTAQAWAVDFLGKLTHYTYWYDHPPLGWVQIAAYAQLTGAWARYSIAVMAGREAMLAATLIAGAVLFFLGRRLHLSRAAAAIAVAIFLISPLAVQFHRTVYLDNVATPWLLAAFLLALSKRRQLLGYAASAGCFGVAVLSKETFLLALPFLGWAMWRNADRGTRRYTIAVAASVLALIGFSYVLLALVKGELVPGRGHVSLITGITFQLGTRQSSGSILNPASLINRTLGLWWQLDWIGLLLGGAASIAALFVRRLRVLAVMMVFFIAMMFRPGGYLPVPFIIMLIPFGALLITGVSQSVVHVARRELAGRRSRSTMTAGLPSGTTVAAGSTSAYARRPIVIARRAAVLAWTAAVLCAVIVAVPLWGSQLRGLLLADLDQPMVQAQSWVEQNVPHTSRLIVDDSMWVDLVRHGFATQNVVWYYKVDTDTAVEALSPNGWRDYDYIITTNSMRTFPTEFPDVHNAIANSTQVATFGSGTTAVDIRKIDPAGASDLKSSQTAASQSAVTTGSELAANPSLTAPSQALSQLKAGQVDARVSVVLGQLLASHSLTLGAFPIVAGEGISNRREVLITSMDGVSTRGDSRSALAAEHMIDSTASSYADAHTRATASGVLVTLPVTGW